MVSIHSVHYCWICGKVVSLESCKIDEHGSAVHERCYVAKVAFNSGTPAQPGKAYRRALFRDTALIEFRG